MIGALARTKESRRSRQKLLQPQVSCVLPSSPERKHVRSEREVYWSPTSTRPVEFFTFDADYLQRLEDQDSATENHFVAYFTSRLLRPKFGCRGVPADQIGDLVQETLKRAIANIREGTGVRHPEALGGFVSKIGDNVYHEYRRDALRHLHEDVDGIEIRAKHLGPEGLLLQKETKAAVHEMLEKLPPRDRGILRGLFLDEKDKDTICEEFGVDRDYLRGLVRRALQKARKYWVDGNARPADDHHGE